MAKTLLKNATIINEGKRIHGDVLISNGRIEKIADNLSDPTASVIDIEGKWLMPGMIDDQVHFREPGLTHKGNIYTESRAAVAGGITSFMEMPNTKPNALTQELLQDKYDIANENAIANYSFFMGASNDNIEEVLKTDAKQVCGVKVFMGSSTGNMLVDNEQTLTGIFSRCEMLIATHCEDEATVRKNLAEYEAKYGENMPIKYHPEIRSVEACYLSSSLAAGLAKKYDTRLHILHLSTAKEMELFRNDIPLKEKRITAEACVHHLWFTDADYDEKGTNIKWNPAVKSASDRDAIWEAVNDNRIDVFATDHAPHTIEERSFWRSTGTTCGSRFIRKGKGRFNLS
jgi:dihydroorotase